MVRLFVYDIENRVLTDLDLSTRMFRLVLFDSHIVE